MKNILLPTDFSENAFNAIQYAIQIFKDEKCTFHLLNTFTPIPYNLTTFADGHSTLLIEEINRENSIKGLKEIEEKIKSEFENPKHTFKRISAFNLLVDEILDVVEERDIDLIVMGTKGATGAREVFLGTNTMFTIRKVKCPVIAVPKDFEYTKPKEVLFPTDFKFSIKNNSLKLLKLICENHQAKLNILNVYFGAALNESQVEVRNQLEEFLKDNNHLFLTTEYVDLVEAIEQFQIKHKVNFLAMIQNKHSFFENLMFKPVIKQLVYHTNVPFMVIPPVE